jgi:ketosteroid isomerase-like protein
LRGEYVGKDEVLGFFGKMMRLYDGTLRLEVLDILAGEKHGAVLTKEEFQHDGKTVTFRSIHLWETHDGKFSAFRVYYDDAYHR